MTLQPNPLEGLPPLSSRIRIHRRCSLRGLIELQTALKSVDEEQTASLALSVVNIDSKP